MMSLRSCSRWPATRIESSFLFDLFLCVFTAMRQGATGAVVGSYLLDVFGSMRVDILARAGFAFAETPVSHHRMPVEIRERKF